MFKTHTMYGDVNVIKYFYYCACAICVWDGAGGRGAGNRQVYSQGRLPEIDKTQPIIRVKPIFVRQRRHGSKRENLFFRNLTAFTRAHRLFVFFIRSYPPSPVPLINFAKFNLPSFTRAGRLRAHTRRSNLHPHNSNKNGVWAHHRLRSEMVILSRISGSLQ